VAPPATPEDATTPQLPPPFAASAPSSALAVPLAARAAATIDEAADPALADVAIALVRFKQLDAHHKARHSWWPWVNGRGGGKDPEEERALSEHSRARPHFDAKPLRLAFHL